MGGIGYGVEGYCSLDAVAQAELIRRREVRPIELVDAAIAQIERVDPQLNAVITPLFDLAREAAQGGLPDGPFKGVPFLLKDLMPLAGVRLTMGSRLLADYVPDHDAELVARYKRAGLIIIGKTNTPELGLTPVCESDFLGPARNPWDTTRTPGGSSGGAAAAVAAGMVPMAHAGDGGGSIRIPASCCGLFGLKPTRARTPLGPDYGDMYSGLVIDHAITRSVRDSAALLDATAGYDAGDPYVAPPMEQPYLEEAAIDPGPLRIGLISDVFGDDGLHADCLAAVLDAARLCEGLGHHIEDLPLPDAPGRIIDEMFNVLWSAGCASDVDAMTLLAGRGPGPDDLEPMTRALAEKGRSYTAATYLSAVMVLQRLAREMIRATSDYDVILTPTLAEPPLAIGTLDPKPDDPLYGYRRAGDFCPFTPIWNVTGQPAMSVPLYWNTDNLPIGVQFVGRFGDEATLFRLAGQLEQARSWFERRPPVS